MNGSQLWELYKTNRQYAALRIAQANGFVCGGFNYFKSGSKFPVHGYVLKSLVKNGQLEARIENDGWTWYYLTPKAAEYLKDF